MKIDIIGANTANGIKLRKKILKIANKIDGKIIINLIDEPNKINHTILYINDRPISSNHIPSEKEIVKHLKNNDKD